MGSVPRLTEPYRAALKGDWEGMKKFYERHRDAVPLPLTVTNDTALHLAVYSGSKTPLEDLLQIAPHTFSIKNDYAITALHEAGAIGNVEAAKVLVRCSEAELDVRSVLGETPLFRSAAFGMTDMVKFLASEVLRVRGDMDNHRTRDDSTSILHIAVHGEHFETAVWLLKNDEKLGELKDKNERTCLQLLANMPSAFKSGYPMGKLKAFLYSCLPNEDNDDDKDEASVPLIHSDNLECGSRSPPRHDRYLKFQGAISRMYATYWKCLAKRWPLVNKIWKAKRKHESALTLAKLLIKKDTSWEQTHTKPDVGTMCLGEKRGDRGSRSKGEKGEANGGSTAVAQYEEEEERKISSSSPETPLLIATSQGIVEIVKEILEVYPQAVEHVSSKGQNIMHVAIRHRQKEIFRWVKEMKIPMFRLVRKIDDDGYTLLHYVADMKYFREGSQPNPALQLQDELQWFKSVHMIINSHYAMHHNIHDETAQELFEKTHTELLKEAQNWLKRTSESCSVIAVLIATVAFTAAYTLPGGSDQETGLPILLNDPFFLVFTVMDVLSLVSSLTSVVMFVSIIMSPFRLQDFHHSLPRKLTLGFTFLFLSVAATMFAFAATVMLIFHTKKQWTTTLIYAVAFVPVTVFALLQFPLYIAFMGTLEYSFRMIKKVIPWNFVRNLFRNSAPSISKIH